MAKIKKQCTPDSLDIFQRKLVPPSALGLFFTVIVSVSVICCVCFLVYQYLIETVVETSVEALEEVCLSAVFTCTLEGGCAIRKTGDITIKNNPTLSITQLLSQGQKQPLQICPGSMEALTMATYQSGINMNVPPTAGFRVGNTGFFTVTVETQQGPQSILISIDLEDFVIRSTKSVGMGSIVGSAEGWANRGYIAAYSELGWYLYSFLLSNITATPPRISLPFQDNQLCGFVVEGYGYYVGVGLDSKITVVKVQLFDNGTMIIVDTHSLSSYSYSLRYIGCKNYGNYGYVIIVDDSSQYYSIILSFSLNDYTTRKADIRGVVSSLIFYDAFGYIGTTISPTPENWAEPTKVMILRVILTTLTINGTLIISESHQPNEKVTSAAVRPDGFSFFGLCPNRIVWIDLNTFSGKEITTVVPSSQELPDFQWTVAFSDSKYAYFGYQANSFSSSPTTIGALIKMPPSIFPLGKLTIGNTTLQYPPTESADIVAPFVTNVTAIDTAWPFTNTKRSLDFSYAAPVTQATYQTYPCDLNYKQQCYRIVAPQWIKKENIKRVRTFISLLSLIGGFAGIATKVGGILLALISRLLLREEEKGKPPEESYRQFEESGDDMKPAALLSLRSFLKWLCFCISSGGRKETKKIQGSDLLEKLSEGDGQASEIQQPLVSNSLPEEPENDISPPSRLEMTDIV